MNGWQMISRQLEHLGVKHVFGLPGTQNAELFSEIALTTTEIVPASSEKAAAFAAIGHAIGSGNPAVLLTIAGPGFCYTAAPLVEATHDSVPLVNIVVGDAMKSDRIFQLQAIDHEGIAARLAKCTRTVDNASALLPTLEWAWHEASCDEPGPIVVLTSSDVLNEEQSPHKLFDRAPPQTPSCDVAIGEAIAMLKGKRVLLFLGRGAAAAQKDLASLAHELNWPVVSTASGRGIVSESDVMVLTVDGCQVSAVNDVIEKFDFVLAIGAKFTHNGSFGFRLRLPESRLIHVDSSAAVLNANYPAKLAIHCDAAGFCAAIVGGLCGADAVRSDADIDKCRDLLDAARPEPQLEPEFVNGEAPSAAEFFALLQRLSPQDSVFVADSGYHQVLMRRHLIAHEPNQIVLPIDFQSMGFGLPAAIGLSKACPGRTIVAVIGDGGFQMCATDLLTAASENLPIVVCVLDDGYYGLIRLQQLAAGNAESGVSLPKFDLESFARSCGVEFIDGTDGLSKALKSAIELGKPVLIRQVILDSKERRQRHSKAAKKGRLRRAIGPEIMGWIRRRQQK